MKRGTPSGVLFDDADRAYVESRCWFIDSEGYASCRDGRLHRLLLGGTARGMVVDHINQNKLDNRRDNLRVVPHYVNLHNCGPSRNSKTGVRGVYLDVREPRRRNKYAARIKVAGKLYILGRFDTLEEAAEALDRKRAELLGDYAQCYKNPAYDRSEDEVPA